MLLLLQLQPKEIQTEKKIQIKEILEEKMRINRNLMGAPSCGHPAYQVVPGCWEHAVQPVHKQGKAPDDIMDVREMQGASVSDAT